MSAQSIPFPRVPVSETKKRKPSNKKAPVKKNLDRKLKAGLDTGEHLVAISGAYEVVPRLEKAATVLQNGIANGATKLAAKCSTGGWFAKFLLKVAAWAPIISKAIVVVAVVAVAVTVYKLVSA